MKPKYYRLGQELLAASGNDRITGPGMIECENGDYVKREDYDKLVQQMESIGAGGVDRKLMPGRTR